MSIKRIIGLVFVGAGIAVLAFGIHSTRKVSERVVKTVEGHYTDTTRAYLIGGVVLIIAGSGLVFLRKKR